MLLLVTASSQCVKRRIAIVLLCCCRSPLFVRLFLRAAMTSVNSALFFVVFQPMTSEPTWRDLFGPD